MNRNENKTLMCLIVAIIALSLLCICTATALLIRRNTQNPPVDDLTTPVQNPPPSIPASSPKLEQTADAGDSYIKKITFFGESTTYGLQAYGVLPDGKATKQVWTGAKLSNGVAATAGTITLDSKILNTMIFYPDTAEQMTLPEALKKKNPEILIVTIGLNNGVSYFEEDEFKLCYEKLVSGIIEASPDTKLILQSIFPVSSNCEIKSFTNERIDIRNGWILDIATKYNVKYLDTNSYLKNESGFLPSNFQNGDGIHLSEAGLLKVLEYIKTHAYPGT